jgi:RNA polymerase sigma factor (sigma-70 family)
MMSQFPTGVDSSFIDGQVTPFVSESSKIFAETRKEAFGKRLSNKVRLDGPKIGDLGSEKGRLDRLYAQYKATPSEDNLNILLAEVERYARRITLGKGGGLANYLSQSVTEQYSASEISSEVMIKVWQKLGEFKGGSKFSVWVFRIARNTTKDLCRKIINRREVDFLEWKGYGDYAGSSGGSSGSTDGSFEMGEGAPQPLPRIFKAPDRQQELGIHLGHMIEGLSPQDQKIIQMSREGDKPSDIGKAFGKNAKWASNALTRIKKLLKQKASLAKSESSGVLVMKDDKDLPASQAAD